MTELDFTKPQTVQLLQRELTERAKTLLAYQRGSQIAVLIVGFASAIYRDYSFELLGLAALFTLLSAVLGWRSDYLKEKGQFYLRKYEYWAGLGWELSEQESSDIYVQIPDIVRKKILAAEDDDYYFTSQSDASPNKLIENLEESSWWSKHLAETSSYVFAALSALLVAIGIGLLLAGIQSDINSQNFEQILVQIVISTFVFTFSAGYVRKAFEYYQFHIFATQVEKEAMDLLKTKEIKEPQALRLVNQYQVTRSSAPIIHTFIYEQRKDRLNESWATHRATLP